MKKFFVVSTLAFLFFFSGCDSKKKVETDEDVQVEVEADVGSSDGTVEATDGTDSTDGTDATDATDVVPEPVDADAGSVDAADLPDAASPASLPDDATGA
jgi:hypothetical protein